MAHEFLPLCDVLFNIISLASYFCDLVFDAVMVYALYEQEHYTWCALSLTFVVTSLLLGQAMSLKWYLQNIEKRELDKNNCGRGPLIILHIFQCGVLWRYFKLFIPVDLRYIKHEVRDLCMLRLMHAFCEAAPMLLIQLYLLWQKVSPKEFSDLNVVSTALSLFSVCWALASFSKNVRLQNVHRLVLTWLGVIFQFLWRLGTVTSRVTSLTVYATVYGYWVLLVIGLHWVTMFLWLISPKNVFHGEKISKKKKALLSALIALVYVFCYINLQEVKPQRKMIAFYVTMFLENTLLVAVWLIGIQGITPGLWYQNAVVVVVFVSFAVGIGFMLLYYRYFHVRRLRYGPSQQQQHQISQSPAYVVGEGRKSLTNGHAHRPFSHLPPNCNGNFYVPGGVFNCRFNPAMKRKKKKPTSFVPVPVLPSVAGPPPQQPFWKRPLSVAAITPVTSVANGGSSETEGSVCSRGVNIRQKLQEKKQQQLAELRVIEEEIQQGKLQQRPRNEVPLCQPIPRAKKQPWPASRPYVVPPPPPHKQHRAHTPEILLAPRYLHESSRYYRDWAYEDDELSAGGSSGDSNKGDRNASTGNGAGRQDKSLYKSYRIPSDIDSQISLPRSYTLPREFKYYRRPKTRKIIRSEHFVTSTNSSDGKFCINNENCRI